MPASADLLLALHVVLLFGFLGVTSMLMLATVANRLRIRHVLRAWGAGRFWGVPLWPSAFLLAMLGGLAYALATDADMMATLIGGYLAGGVCWLVAARIAATVVVTDFGLITNTNRSGSAVAWSQIIDYFEYEKGASRSGYVLFYRDEAGTRRRLELPVPPRHRAPFARLMEEKVDARFEFTAQQVYGRKALEGGLPSDAD